MNDDETREYLERMYLSIREDVGQAWQAYTGDEEYEGQDAGEYLDELHYGIGARTVLTITLAGGGPSAWVEVTCYEDGPVLGEYVANWAGLGVRHRLDLEDGGLGEWAAQEAERYLESR